LITEYLTKFPHGFPIKTKTSQEKAERLFEYIALLGSSDLMLSDMGKEVCIPKNKYIFPKFT
jgi:hypothetical protein